MKKSLLVTGHKGFIGSALLSTLRRDAHLEIVGVSRSEGGDLLFYETLADLPKVDQIVHLAAAVGVSQSWDRPYETYRNNIISTLNLLEFAHIHRTPLIYVSSYVYGPPRYLPVDEAHPINCGSPYARSKRQAEMLCEAFAADFGVAVTILRPFNLYGPGQTQHSLIPTIIRQAREKNSILVKDLRPRRDYLYIDDLVAAVVKVIHSAQAGLAIYNLGCGKSYSVKEVIDAVLKVAGKQLPVRSTGERRPNQILDCYSDFQKFSGRFAWQPQVSFVAGIGKLWQSQQSRENYDKCR